MTWREEVLYFRFWSQPLRFILKPASWAAQPIPVTDRFDTFMEPIAMCNHPYRMKLCIARLQVVVTF